MRKALVALALVGACSVPLGVFVAVKAQNQAETRTGAPASMQDAPTQDAPTQDAPTQDAPTQDAPTQDAPTQDAPTQDAPTQDAPTQDAPTQDAPAQAKSAPAAKPQFERQTAQSWTGDPLTFEYPNRDQTLKIPQVFRALKIGKGSRVADVGAGGGWLSTRLARQVGAKGTVYAEEILPRYVEFLQGRARREKLPQMKTVLGTTSDPKLPQKLDAVLILNAYHEFDKPLEMLAKIKGSMKVGARLGFIERDNPELRIEAETAYRETGQIKRRVDEQNDDNPITDDHRLALPIVEREAAQAGFKKVSSMQLGDDNYLLVVEKTR